MGISAVMFAVVFFKLSKKLVKAIPFGAIAELAIRACLIGAKYMNGKIDTDTLKAELTEALKGAIFLDLIEELVRVFAGNDWKLMSYDQEAVEYFNTNYYSYADDSSKSYSC